jgi:hypothetical protein
MGFIRRIKRNQAKLAYQKFSKQWVAERAYQKWTLESGGSLGDAPVLGPKPSFQKWLKIVKTPKAFDTKPEVIKDFVDDIPELSWDDNDFEECKLT